MVSNPIKKLSTSETFVYDKTVYLTSAQSCQVHN